MSILEINNLSFSYGIASPGGDVQKVFDNLSLLVEENESVGLVGANGVGKPRCSSSL